MARSMLKAVDTWLSDMVKLSPNAWNSFTDAVDGETCPAVEGDVSMGTKCTPWTGGNATHPAELNQIIASAIASWLATRPRR